MPPKNHLALFKSDIEKRVRELLKTEFSQPDADVSAFKFETPPNEAMGHLALACFPLAKIAKRAPGQIAEVLASRWGESRLFQKIAATGPYLNFFFSPAFLAKELLSVCAEDIEYGNSTYGEGKTIMVEYSSPNTNKPLHLGHCRNNLLGTSIVNLLEKAGYRVVKTNLVNDRGIHICKSMYAYRRWGDGETPESAGVKGDKLVGKYYVIYSEKEKENPDILRDVRQMLRDWENGEREVISLWKKMNGWVMDGFRKTYARMGVTFDKFYFESETYQGGKEAVNKALEAGICRREPNGAVSIDLEAEDLGRKILLRGDGTAMYITQDINTTVQKFEDYTLDGSLFIVGNEQDNHFRLLFTILEKFGYGWAACCEHVSYGMIALPEGKMKSREGMVVDLDDLMDKMKGMALEELEKRYGDTLPQEIDREDTAEAIGQSAIKYFILKTNAARDICFNPRESLSFDGATGPYLQYTHARICSLLKKAGSGSRTTSSDSGSWQEEEIRVMVHLLRFPDAIAQSAKNRNPAILCAYIYDVCRSYNNFYCQYPILKTQNPSIREARLLLSQATKNVIAKTLDILGIEPQERM